ncbi:hypothetical protein AX17_000323 [Amanita inopinata Kibby_2008]|nr:hypothetical protein AX17_000323 [Amanita inopinata Kibby_2008]
MSAIPTSISVGSVSSARSAIGDALNSYRRAQYIIAGSPIVPSIEISDIEDNVGEGCAQSLEGSRRIPVLHASSQSEDLSLDQPSWRDEVGSGPYLPIIRAQQRYHPIPHQCRDPRPSRQSIKAHENTPLIRAVASPGHFAHPSLPAQEAIPSERTYYAVSSPCARRPSATSSTRLRYHHGGQSTFGQTLFNSIAILLGVGVLSEPLAFAYAGWIMGTVLIVCYACIACYTAKILTRMIISDPRLKTYSDIGRKAFGPGSHIIVSFLFCLELFAVGVILVTIYADSLHVIFPQYSASTYKVAGVIILIPMVFLPLSLLSYTSVLGTLSTVLLVAVIFIDGFSKRDMPGSLWHPAETRMGIQSFDKLGIAFGLLMAGFAGHAVIPSLARDMIDPSRCDEMINWAFAIATIIYASIGYAGYLMFGDDVSDEISQDLLRTKGYNPVLNQAALWMLVISPLSKFALNIRPLNTTMEVLTGAVGSVDETKPKEPYTLQPRLGKSVVIVQRIVLTLLTVVISISVPDFSTVMAFLGSFSAFIINIVGPIAAKVAIQGRCSNLDGVLIAIGIVMAVWGTVATFSSA